MIKDHLETIMMIAFLLATALSIYKVYVIFEKQADDGIDLNTIENELIEIIKELFSSHDVQDKKHLHQLIQEHNDFDKERYRNYNENRLNQILDRLFLEHKIEGFEGLKNILSNNR